MIIQAKVTLTFIPLFLTKLNLNDESEIEFVLFFLNMNISPATLTPKFIALACAALP